MSTKLYAHMSWTTDGRLPMIGPSEEKFLRQFLPAVADKHKVVVVAMGVVANHMHMVLIH